MFELIKENQLNIMLMLCGICAGQIVLLIFTRFLSKTRKAILMLMEVIALFLLGFDRQCYVYSGKTDFTGFMMVRVSNFMVFFLTSSVVFGFSIYLSDYLKNEGEMKKLPLRIRAVTAASVVGMLLAVVSALTGLYYYFDANNVYHRGRGFIIAYIIPVLGPLILYTVIRQYKKMFSRFIYLSLVLYIFVPIVCGIVQIFAYGISIVNMAMAVVSISLYIFAYLDINETVVRAHDIEIQNMLNEKKELSRLFNRTATAFITALEKRDEYSKGYYIKIAECAKRLAAMNGKSEEDCEKAYYAGLLHDIGRIALSDTDLVFVREDENSDMEELKKNPTLGKEILETIPEYPFLAQAAYYCHEKYDGTGYPEGLKGEDIPEIARIVKVAGAFVSMSTRTRFSDGFPPFVAREAMVKGSGEDFDPVYAGLMIKILDIEAGAGLDAEETPVETSLSCGEYRDVISIGIPVENYVKCVSFKSVSNLKKKEGFSAPSIVLFDSYDRRVHTDDRTISAYNYLEYGEIWFDEHMINTAARAARILDLTEIGDESKRRSDKPESYEIIAFRFDDHLKLEMTGPRFSKEIVIALPDGTKSAYIGITGENVDITDISVKSLDEEVGPEDIPRIADQASFIDHMESDIMNIQIDRTRSASTEGIEIDDKFTLAFHTMSLPGACLVWHCPYVVIFRSDDGKVNGEGYVEYALIKLNGENDETNEAAQNRFIMKRGENFPGWDQWKAANLEGMECEVSVERKGNRIFLKTENLGIKVENTTTLFEPVDKVYIALTGDQVALTDIRIVL
ncbi:MAG: HD domain-containing protein [Lachnospiraceae bacterium]|nr:HD domain-containing protein [Lachnospiraceae bacterium]